MKRREFLSVAAAAVTVPALGQVPNPPVLSIGGTFDYYISPTGDDVLGNGTLSNPWSITALNSQHSTYAGKRVGLLPGVYQYGKSNGTQTALWSMLSSMGGGGDSGALQVNGGTSASPTYIASCSASGVYSPRTAILDGSNPSTGAQPTGAAIFIGQSDGGSPVPPNAGYVTIDGIVVRNWNYAGIGFAGHPYSFPGITIQNCEIYNGSGVPSSNNPGGIFVWKQAPGVLIQNCKIHDLQTIPGGANAPWGFAGVMFNQDPGSTEGFSGTVDHCTIYRAGQCVTTKNNVSNVKVQYCYLEFANMGVFTGSAFQWAVYGGMQAAGTSVTHKYNVFAGGGIAVRPEDGTANAGNVTCQNCTFYCASPGSSTAANDFFWFDPNASTGSGAFNHNIVWSDGGYSTQGNGVGAIGYNSVGAGMTFDYNYYGTGCKFGGAGGSYQSFSTWHANGQDPHGSSIASTPFVTTPSSLNISSFVPSSSYLTASDGKPCGALNSSGQAADGSGSIGCNF
jgi:hypothetical protein